MFKSAHVHLINKYPGSQVISTEGAIDVFTTKGHAVAIRRDGAGQWRDVSAELGCYDRFSLAPIPKHARFFKLHADGSMGEAEEAASRKPKAQAYAERFGCVPAISDLADSHGCDMNDQFMSKLGDDKEAALPSAK